ncbi:MAG: rRNA adenine dimethyltransferase family protein [Fervidicoccaceae archaeon]
MRNPQAIISEEFASKISSDGLRKITRHFLKEAGIRPSRRLGQNFAVSRDYLETLSSSASSQYNEILEIGTGIGFLTAFLISRMRGFVISVEKDPRLFELASKNVESSRVALVLGDGIEILRRTRIPLVISSTPFSLSVPIFLEIARNNSIRESVLGVQSEVAMRIAASPGDENYGRISVLSSLLFEREMKGTFSSNCFAPRPKVSVTVIRLVRKRDYDNVLHSILEKISGCLFSQRNRVARKVVPFCMERLNLKIDVETGRSILREVENLRVREIAPWQMEELARAALMGAQRS